VIRLDTLDISLRDAVWLTKALGFESAAALAAHGRGQIMLPSLRKAPDVAWHMWQFNPTPRQLKRVLWQFKLHKRAVAASAKSKMRRGLNLKGADGAEAGVFNGAGAFSSLVAAASKVRTPARPIGVPLVSTRTANEGGVTAMTSARHWLVTAGRDNVVRLWDLQESLKPTGSRLMHAQPFKNAFGNASDASSLDDPANTILFAHFTNTDDPQSVVALGNARGQMRLLDIGSGKAQTVFLGNGDVGGLSTCVSLSPKVMIVGTHRGGLYAVDIRAPSREAWSTHVPRSRGPISCMTTVNDDAPFGIACGTLRGYLAIFDLRFRTQMASTSLPQSPAVFDMVGVQSGSEAKDTPSIAVATSHHDVVRLNASTFQETMSFRPSPANSVRCLCTSNEGASLFSGGVDGVIRHWNLAMPESSKSVLMPPHRSRDYNFSRGAYTIAEVPGPPLVTASNVNPALGLTTGTNHHDSITRIRCVTGSGGQHFLVSASRDGAVTVWRNAAAPGPVAAPK
jgi:WD40 repeat protein